MVMGPAHRAIAAPFGIALAMCMDAVGEPTTLALAAGVVVVATSKLPDGDHPMHKGKLRPVAALMRGVARVGYSIRTELDQERHDLHRGPTHCVEVALLSGVAVGAVLAAFVPFLAGAPAWWIGAAVTLGCATHILGDVITPSGVPVSAVYSYLRHGQLWRRYSLGLLRTNSGAERFVLVPFTWLASALVVAAWLGALGPMVALATGWSS